MNANRPGPALQTHPPSNSPLEGGRALLPPLQGEGRGGDGVPVQPPQEKAADGVIAYIALGANLGDPAAQIECALEELAALPETRLVAQSGLYRSCAVGYAEQPDFINAVAEIHTHLAPRRLLDALLEIETRHGRRREFKNAPRTLDLDLLLYGDLALHEHGLTLPHPRMIDRAFVLRPLAEIAPHRSIPGQGRVADHLAALGNAGDTCTIIPRPSTRES